MARATVSGRRARSRPLTGQLLTRQSGTGGSATNIQNLAYTWDSANNLTQRQDLRQSLTETFGYDGLDRLTSAAGPGGTLAVGYDAIGNVTSRSDVGSGATWTYHASKKHAVTAAGSFTFGYDANGNVSTRNGSTISWYSYNLPATINGGGFAATFDYAPDRSRWRQQSTYSGSSETTIYVGGLLEKFTTPTRTHWKHLIDTPSGQVQHVRRSDATTETYYLVGDHLGSVDAIMNAAGAVQVRTSFAAFGARRDDDWVGLPSAAEYTATANSSRRGFTGHEMLDNVGLIHMNGRVYDAAIGRFISADPFIDCFQNPQGWNRYLYLKGRVASATDSSGFSDDGQAIPGWIDAPGTIALIEEVVVTASRIFQRCESCTTPLVSYNPVPGHPGLRPNGGGGGGGGQGQANQETKYDKCKRDCKQENQKYADAAVGAIRGAASGIFGGWNGVALGAFLGGAEAFASSGQGPSGTVIVGATAGYASGRTGGTAAGRGGAVGGAVSGVLTAAGIPNGAANIIGGAVGGAVANPQPPSGPLVG